MPKLLALLFAIFGASQASAESCPDYFRFVDFGLVDRDGVTHRGGTLFRVESIEGVPQ